MMEEKPLAVKKTVLAASGLRSFDKGCYGRDGIEIIDQSQKKGSTIRRPLLSRPRRSDFLRVYASAWTES
jgi:hypothetical protein